jgi:coatomer subunit beta'
MLVHPHQPYLLTSSDDAKIKLWDMDNNFNLIRVLEDHIHYVMMLSLNPRDSNTFASASLDKNIKVWTLQTTNTKANFTLCH